jgi:hypothetical protein
MKVKINIPFPLLIIWLEVNIYGKTILPELFCYIIISIYILSQIVKRSISWRLMLEIKPNGIRMEYL